MKRKVKRKKTTAYYNEYDVDPRKAYLERRRRKKISYFVKALSVLLVLGLMTGFFYSDFSRIKSVSVEGHKMVPESYITQGLSITAGKSHYMFLNKKKIISQINNKGLISQTKIKRDFLGNVAIEVSETKIMAYTDFKKNTYVIDSKGRVVKVTSQMTINNLQQYPKLYNFDNLALIARFAEAYVQIDPIIQASVSDIIFAPEPAYPTRVRLIMNNGKELLDSIEDIPRHLIHEVFDYQAYVTQYSNAKVFKFEGDYLYFKENKVDISNNDD